MHKKISHLLFVLILCVVSFCHYDFIKKDTRTSYDFDGQCYGSLAVSYCQLLEGKSLSAEREKPQLYAKVLGYVFYFFGKSYFAFRLASLFFFMFYLIVLYVSVSVILSSFIAGLLSVLLNVSVPGFISYSRLCWPHMWAASFTLLGFLFLFLFLKDKKAKIFNMLLSLLFLAVSVAVYYSSLIYVFLIGLWFLLYTNRKIFASSKIFLFLLTAIILGGLFCFFFSGELLAFFVEYAESLELLSAYFKGKYFSFQFFYEYSALFGSRILCGVYSLLIISALGFLFFVKKNKAERKGLTVFVLFLLFSLISSFIGYPLLVTMLGMTSVCVLNAWFVFNVLPVFWRYLVLAFFLVLFMTVSFFPNLIISEKNANLYPLESSLLPHSGNWGREELKVWLGNSNHRNKNLSVLADTFYPASGINYLQPFDILLLASSEINVVILDAACFFDTKTHLGDKSGLQLPQNFNFSLKGDIAIKETVLKHLQTNLKDRNISYFVFDDIFDAHSAFLVFSELVEVYEASFSEQMDFNGLKELKAAAYRLFPSNIAFYIFNIDLRLKSLKKYLFIQDLLKNSDIFTEVKRIKCEAKDVVIYTINK